MTKVNGSLGFTLRKEDHSALGHYVRALVREPALSDGRIQPGDRIVAVSRLTKSIIIMIVKFFVAHYMKVIPYIRDTKVLHSGT